MRESKELRDEWNDPELQAARAHARLVEQNLLLQDRVSTLEDERDELLREIREIRKEFGREQ
jgi:hypothetical protein